MEHKDILARAANVADSAEIYSTRSQSIRVGFENNFIKESSSSDLSATGVRVIKDGRIGFSSSSKPGDGSIADMAADLSQFGKPVKFAFPGPGTVQHLPPDSAGSPPSESDAVSTCEGAVDSLRSLGDGIMAFSGISSHEVTGKLLNTAGFEGEQSHSRISSYCGLVQNKEGNFLQLFESKVSRSFGGFGPMISKVSEDYRLCATNEKLKTRKYRVLFTPRGFSHLLGVFSAC
ncbi:MAG: DNA gyrase modulator, partial [Candidatus Brocadiia bacterium]